MAASAVQLVDEPGALSAGIALPVVSAVVVLFRFGTRRRQGSRYGPDDWLTLAALVMLTGMGACIIVAVERGLLLYPHPPGEHLRPYSQSHGYLVSSSSSSNSTSPTQNEQYHEAFVVARQSLWIFQLLMFPTSAFTKLSILYYYRRVFWPDAYPIFGISIRIVSGLVLIWSFVFFFLTLFSCGAEIPLNWSPMAVYLHHCNPQIRLEWPYAISDLIINLLLLILPLPSIHQLHLSLRRRAAVGAVQLLGSSAIAASAVRVVLLTELTDTNFAFAAPGASDATVKAATALILHISSTMMYWSLIEGALALQTACLPTLCVLLPRKVLGSSAGGRVGSLVTQVGIQYGEGGGDGATATHGYRRSSGWFAGPRPGTMGDSGNRPRNMASIDVERLAFQRIESDATSEISELDLASTSNTSSSSTQPGRREKKRERSVERGRSRERKPFPQSVVDVQVMKG